MTYGAVHPPITHRHETRDVVPRYADFRHRTRYSKEINKRISRQCRKCSCAPEHRIQLGGLQNCKFLHLNRKLKRVTMQLKQTFP